VAYIKNRISAPTVVIILKLSNRDAWSYITPSLFWGLWLLFISDLQHRHGDGSFESRRLRSQATSCLSISKPLRLNNARITQKSKGHPLNHSFVDPEDTHTHSIHVLLFYYLCSWNPFCFIENCCILSNMETRPARRYFFDESLLGTVNLTGAALATLYRLPKTQSIELRKDWDTKSFSLDSPKNTIALLAHRAGTINKVQCLNCQAGHGYFKSCVNLYVTKENGELEVHFKHACTNCKVGDEHTYCSFRGKLNFTSNSLYKHEFLTLFA
jgi:hypothetical protein